MSFSGGGMFSDRNMLYLVINLKPDVERGSGGGGGEVRCLHPNIYACTVMHIPAVWIDFKQKDRA